MLVITGIVILQIGAALAGRMFGVVSPAALTGLRLWWAALILAVLGGRGAVATVRAVIADRAWRDAAVVLAFGVTLGIMNYSIYQSFARIPLGVAVTIEFLGPLAVAVASSRRLVDGAWVLLAGAGVALLSEGFGGHRSVAGIAFALAAATSWAVYILLSRATGRRFTGSAGLTIAIVVAAVVVTPAAAAGASAAMLRPSVLSITLAVALLSSVIPYRLELEALRRIPARVFGIWMSLEPAVAALAGLLILGEALSARQWLAIGCVTVASAGAARNEAGKADRAGGGAPAAGGARDSDTGRGLDAGRGSDAGPARARGRAVRPDASERAPGCRRRREPEPLPGSRWAMRGVGARTGGVAGAGATAVCTVTTRALFSGPVRGGWPSAVRIALKDRGATWRAVARGALRARRGGREGGGPSRAGVMGGGGAAVLGVGRGTSTMCRCPDISPPPIRPPCPHCGAGRCGGWRTWCWPPPPR